MPYLARITIYPVKSLDGQEMHEARVLPSGALENDRRFALFDRQGKVVNGKRTAAVHALRSAVDFDNDTIALRKDAHAFLFPLKRDVARLEAFFAEHFGFPVRVRDNAKQGFPDDLEAAGPTIVSTATLDAVAAWFPGLTVEEVRRRFRPNLEIGGVEPFWEDRLYGDEGQTVPFAIGDVLFEGTNPCQRCVVPTRHPSTGDILPEFAKVFADKRRESLPSWANAARFDHYYRLAGNMRVKEDFTGGTIRVGDEIVSPPDAVALASIDS